MIFKGAARRQGSTGGVARLHRYITDSRKADAVSYEHLIDGRTAPAVMQALAERNVRVQDPLYHGIISWPTHERPNDEQMFGSARTMLRELGFADHHAVLAIHRNTNHHHVHIMVLRVHPDTLRAHSPFNDYLTADRVCRELELRHGFAHDKGPHRVDLSTPEPRIVLDRRDPEVVKPARVVEKAREYERATGDMSFQSWVAGDVAAAVRSAASWGDVHRGLAGLGVAMERKGSGYVLRSLADPEQVAKFSHTGLGGVAKVEKRLGTYEAPATPAAPVVPSPPVAPVAAPLAVRAAPPPRPPAPTVQPSPTVQPPPAQAAPPAPQPAAVSPKPPAPVPVRQAPPVALPPAALPRGIVASRPAPESRTAAPAPARPEVRRPAHGPDLGPLRAAFEQRKAERTGRQQVRDLAWEGQRAREGERRANLVEGFRTLRARLREDRAAELTGGTPAETRRTLDGMVALERAARRDALRTEIRAERDALRTGLPTAGPMPRWDDFLREQAKAGDQAAAREYARLARRTGHRPTQAVPAIQGERGPDRARPTPGRSLADMTLHRDRFGALAYRWGEDVALRDTGREIQVVSTAADVGELRAIADILGHSPEMLLNTYSHAL